MSEFFNENLLAIQVVVFLTFVAVAAWFLLARKPAEKKDLEVGTFETIEQKDTRYQEKKASRGIKKDVNRFGRWALLFKNGDRKTRVGMLYSILRSDSNIKTYREIK